jgi:hypothetical protein
MTPILLKTASFYLRKVGAVTCISSPSGYLYLSARDKNGRHLLSSYYPHEEWRHSPGWSQL